MAVKFNNTPVIGDLAQTFYVDAAAVKGATQVFISSVELFFFTKPYDEKLGLASSALVYGNNAKLNTTKSTSQLSKPGVSVFIVPTKIENQIHVPDTSKHLNFGRSRVEFDDITSSEDGSTSTKFTFKYPVQVNTQTTYAFVIKFDGSDAAFTLWRNKIGETFTEVSEFVSTTGVARGAYDGHFFYLTNGLLSGPSSDTDLKFKLNIARFNTTSKTISAVNRNFEIISYDGANKTGNFIGGEYVFANTGYPAAQTVSTSSQSNSITGSGTTFLTTFTVNDLIVLNSGTTNSVRKITAITSDTVMRLDFNAPFTNAVAKYMKAPLAKVWDYSPTANTLVLIASTANSTFNFNPNATVNTVIGVISGASVKPGDIASYPINVFEPNFIMDTPPGTTANVFIKLANSTYNTIDTAYNVTLFDKHIFNRFGAMLHSRTDEVTTGSSSLLNGKSVNFLINLSTENEFVTPVVEEENLIFSVDRRIIDANNTNEHVFNGGLAKSKYVGRFVALESKQTAEDMIVFLNAYRPYGSYIDVYAKFYNNQDPESFDSKNWSKLESVSPTILYSSLDNKNDVVTLEYRVPNFPVDNSASLTAGSKLTGTFTGVDGNSSFVSESSTTVNTEIANTDIVRIYNTSTPNNSLIAVVTSSNSTSFTIDRALNVANTVFAPFVTTGLVAEKVVYKNSAFKNITRSEILRYYNYQNATFDGYNSYQLKVVLRADDTYFSPIIYDIRGIACSV